MKKPLGIIAGLAAITLSIGLTSAAPAGAATLLPAPSYLHQSTPAPTNTTIDIGWNPVAGATGYQVKRSGLPAYTGSTTGTHFQFTLLSPGTAYTLSVATKNAAGVGPAASITIKTTGTVTPPPPGFGISITGVTAVNSKQPYAPYNSGGFGTNQGGYDCTLYYHEYAVTSGCGGAWVYIQVTGSSTTAYGQITAYADFSRTFGCVTNHQFTATEVITEKHRILDGVHAGNYFSSDIGAETKAGPIMNFKDFVNYDPNYIYCPYPSVEGQLGLKVSNVVVTVESNELPTKTSTFAGPWYSPPATF